MRFGSSSTGRGTSSPTRKAARQVVAVQHPAPNHNGGQLAFGPDGRLYFGLGDGGGRGDPNNLSQSLRSPMGKLFRIDVNRRAARAQMMGFGLRNPWRFSFDRQTGDLYIGDVGQDAWEEIDFTPAESPGLENYGWRVYEGETRNTDEEPNPAGALIPPVHVYGRAGGAAVTGGFVYRGRAVPACSRPLLLRRLRQRAGLDDRCRSGTGHRVPARALQHRGPRVVRRRPARRAVRGLDVRRDLPARQVAR